MEFNSFIKKIKVDTKIEEHEITFEDKLELNGNGYVVYDVVGSNYIKYEFLGVGVVIDSRKYFLTPSDLKKKEVKEYFENEKYYKYVFDYKGLAYIFRKYDIELKGVIFDLLIASYLINPAYASDDFKVVAENYRLTDLPYYENVFGANTKLHKPEEKIYQNYILKKCLTLQEIKDEVFSKVIDNELEYLMFVEMNLSQVLSKMEYDGLKVDLNKLEKIGKDFTEKALQKEERIYYFAKHLIFYFLKC